MAISVGRVKSCRNPQKDKPILDEEAIRLLLNAPPNTKIGIRVVGKGQKERVIAFTERTSEHLKKYLSIYHLKRGGRFVP